MICLDVLMCWVAAGVCWDIYHREARGRVGTVAFLFAVGVTCIAALRSVYALFELGILEAA